MAVYGIGMWKTTSCISLEARLLVIEWKKIQLQSEDPRLFTVVLATLLTALGFVVRVHVQ
jgi:hypothetical protein